MKTKKHVALALIITLVLSICLTPVTSSAARKSAKLPAPKVKWATDSGNSLKLKWKKVPKAYGYTVWIYREDEDIDDLYYIEKRKNVYSLSFSCEFEEDMSFYKIVVKPFKYSKGKRIYGKAYTKYLVSGLS